MESKVIKIMKFIEFKNVSFQYGEEDEVTAVLNDFNLEIEKGSFVSILGHNGSGKSTVARLMNGLRIPSSGKVLVEGFDTADEENEFEIKKRVGLVFQNPDNQIIATVVEDDVAFGPENLGIDPKEIRERVDNALKAVDMYDYRLNAPHLLSGGQKQRIAIAGILALEPECIVLDEPTAMLDPQGRREVLDSILKLNREKGITVVLITHYMDEATLADRIVVMDDGRIVMDDKPSEVFKEVELLSKAGLSVPQSAEFAYKLKSLGIELKGDILSDEDLAETLASYLLEEK